jgi:hypothetical protein
MEFAIGIVNMNKEHEQTSEQRAARYDCRGMRWIFLVREMKTSKVL